MAWKLYAFSGNDEKPRYLESESDYDDAGIQAVWEEAWNELPATLTSSVLRWGKRTDLVLGRLVEDHGFRIPVPVAGTADADAEEGPR